MTEGEWIRLNGSGKDSANCPRYAENDDIEFSGINGNAKGESDNTIDPGATAQHDGSRKKPANGAGGREGKQIIKHQKMALLDVV